MLRKIPAALLVAALLIAIPGVVGLIRDEPSGRQAAAVTPSAADSGMLDTAQRVAFWRARVVHESDYLNRVQLSASLLESARQTGDLSAYAEARQVIDEALEANPDSRDALAVQAAVLFGLHDFSAAFAIANEILHEDPTSLQALAVGGDALLELGRYDEAGQMYDRLFAAEQGPAVLVRQARLAWHRGDTTSAVLRAEQALQRANEARLAPADVAFYALQLATYLHDTGDLAEALDLALAAVDVAPDLPATQATLGRVVAATGDLETAAQHYELASAIIPRPEYVAALGDLYLALGDDVRAAEQYDAVEAIARLGKTEREVYNRELARFFADHDRQLDQALVSAEAEFATRKDVYGYDTLAWALFKNDRVAEAAEVASELAALGSRDPIVLYHLGRIAYGTRDADAALGWLTETVAINANFDPIHGPTAAELLESITTERDAS